MNIMALDPAKQCGWAFVGPAGRVISGTEAFDAPTFGNRAHHYREWLRAKLTDMDVDMLAIEAMYTTPHGSNEQTERWLRAVNCLAHEVCAARHMNPPEEVSINVWRATFIGVSKAPKHIGADEPKKRQSYVRRQWLKNRVMMQCRELGFNPKDDNEADALGVLEHVRRKYDREYGAVAGTMFDRGAA